MTAESWRCDAGCENTEKTSQTLPKSDTAVSAVEEPDVTYSCMRTLLLTISIRRRATPTVSCVPQKDCVDAVVSAAPWSIDEHRLNCDDAQLAMRVTGVTRRCVGGRPWLGATNTRRRRRLSSVTESTAPQRLTSSWCRSAARERSGRDDAAAR